MILTSSFAVPDGPIDALSDYDVILYLTDIHPYTDDRAWLGDFGTVLAAWHDPISMDDGLETSAYVTQYEDPTLRQTFGEDNEVYCRAVGRWWPRATPWHAHS